MARGGEASFETIGAALRSGPLLDDGLTSRSALPAAQWIDAGELGDAAYAVRQQMRPRKPRQLLPPAEGQATNDLLYRTAGEIKVVLAILTPATWKHAKIEASIRYRCRFDKRHHG